MAHKGDFELILINYSYILGMPLKYAKIICKKILLVVYLHSIRCLP
jgi:hypothetical protein